MKKLLMLSLITLLTIFAFTTILNGIKIGNVGVWGIKDMQKESKKLDVEIQQAGRLAEVEFSKKVNDVKDDTKKLKSEKEEYESMTAISEDGDIKAANQIEKYEVETLWVRLGNHATSQGVVMKMDITTGPKAAKEVYNLKFTATGSYISITDFISAIENDSTLGFKIEEFKMEPLEKSSDLKATFICKDVMIKDVKENPKEDKKDKEDKENKKEGKDSETKAEQESSTDTETKKESSSSDSKESEE